MNKNQKAWVDALRSGEFKQGNGLLQREDEFCCLGVACILAERDGVEVSRSEHDEELLGMTLRHQPAVQEWLGLTSDNGDLFTNSGMPLALTIINDDGNDFNVIANVIEQNADKLFVQEVA